MLRSPRSWADGAAVLAVALGIAAERATYPWSNVGHWLPDLVTGWVLAGAGLVVLRRDARSRQGSLLFAAGLAWFAGNFATHAVLLHRAVLLQALLTFPTGRMETHGRRAVVAVAYVLAIGTTFAWGNGGSIATACLLLLAAGARVRNSRGGVRRAQQYALRFSALFGIALLLHAAVFLATADVGLRRASTLLYMGSACAVAAALALGVLRRPWERAVTDLVIDLGELRTRSIGDALAHALGDPTLVVGYRVDGAAGYVDAQGREVTLPAPGGARRTTRVRREGEEVAVIVHDAAVLDDATLRDAVTSATRLSSSNARLQAAVLAQVREIDASRRRVLVAADAERRRLEFRLHDGAARRLELLAAGLERARRDAGPAAAARIEATEMQLAKVRRELAELAAGLHPFRGQGLAAALEELARRSPVPVELDVRVGQAADETEVALYFICAEALANVAKYAGASHVRISAATEQGRVVLAISDDGVGGADVGRGTGLRGLSDRVETLGGTFTVASEAGRGTRIVAELPLATASRAAGRSAARAGTPRRTGRPDPSAAPE